MSDCSQLVEFASAGVAPALRAVDCMAGETTAMAFGRLFGAEGALVPALTIILTLYIAFFALSLLAGRSRLSIPALTPKMLTLGLVLTFATSWMAYSQVVWNLAVGAPDQLAALLMGARGSATQIFADRIDIVMAAIGEVSQVAGAGQAADQGAAAQGAASGSFTPANLMWLGALLLLLGTVGVLVTARIALAVLLALGPVFVVFALFAGTRGLTAGWLRGVVMTGVTPLFVVVGGSFILELMVPVIAALGGLEGINPRAAMALFLIAAVHVALMAMVMKVAWAIVSGWQVFGLDSRDADAKGGSPAVHDTVVAPAAANAAPASSSRRPGVSAPVTGGDAAVAGAGPAGGNHTHTRRTVTTQVAAPSAPALPPLARPRARGIGSRFRAPSPQPRQMAR
ncbi:MAG: type IV secretion system protein [Novosphingobium sp.]|nr:type IV secretion system protein [Novosphingobium sp.]MCP5402208.1 type IV secretion system protein [Novosphingobium sp.]